MSKYTMQVRWIIEQTANSPGLTISQKIDKAAPLIFDFDFPIWSESYRLMLERKILMHYFNREIGLETIGLWKLYLNERLNMIMPYYNELYEVTNTEFDFLTNIDYTESETDVEGETENKTRDKTEKTKFSQTILDDGVSKTENNYKSDVTQNTAGNTNDTIKNSRVENSSNTELNSDLPQANYAGVDYGTLEKQGEHSGNITDTNTADRVNKEDVTKGESVNSTVNITTMNDNITNSDNDLTNKENENNKRDLNRTKNKNVKGYNGNKSLTELMVQYRQALLNIDKMIIDELSDLFMNIY